MRLRFPFLAPLLAAATLCCTTATSDEFTRVHRAAPLIDTHNDVTSFTVDGRDIGANRGLGHTDIQRFRQGGVGATFFAIYVAADYAAKGRAAHRALEMIDTVKRDIVGRYPNDFVLARTADEIETARKQGKIAALMGIEGGHAIEESLRLLRTFHDLGVRYMTLTHSNTNNWADSSGMIGTPGEKRHGGLSDFGREVVLEMNRLGMMVDISHVSDDTFADVLETSRAPVFASHSSCRAVTNVGRNMTDDMIRAMARKGGVIQINFACQFVSEESAAASRAKKPRVRAALEDVVAHIDHAVKIGGIDAVGIGSDFDGISCTPRGLDDVSKFPDLTRALLKRGYSAEDIRKLYRENTLRLMRAVEKVAASG
ncbi:MAG: dipeptidase [Bryobacteraceae bacterium]